MEVTTRQWIDLEAPKEINDRAKVLGVDAEINIILTSPPANPEEQKALEDAITAAHKLILEQLEQSPAWQERLKR